MELSFLYFKRLLVKVSLKRCIFYPWNLFSSLQTVQTLVKYRIMCHFIKAFTVCKSTCYGKNTYGVQPHEMYKNAKHLQFAKSSSNCILLEKMSAHPWKYWLSAYWFLPYCFVKSSIEIHKCIFGHTAIHQYWLTQFHKAFLTSHQLDYAI